MQLVKTVDGVVGVNGEVRVVRVDWVFGADWVGMLGVAGVLRVVGISVGRPLELVIKCTET